MTKKKRSLKQTNPPQIGIFWTVDDEVLVKSISVHDATEVEGKRDSDDSHQDVWEQICLSRKNLRAFSYDHFPRGRVIYDAAEDRFHLYGDKCILKREDLVNRIIESMTLSNGKTDAISDIHYRCRSCNPDFLSDSDLPEI